EGQPVRGHRICKALAPAQAHREARSRPGAADEAADRAGTEDRDLHRAYKQAPALTINHLSAAAKSAIMAGQMILALALLLATPDASAAAPVALRLEQAKAARKAGEGERALELLKPLADAGNPEALGLLAALYRNGEGVKADPAAAMRLFIQAAGKGYAPALTGIGALYENGEGVAKDPAKAVAYYRQAAAKGVADAYHYLAYDYYAGTGVPVDYRESVKWSRKGAGAGSA